MLQKFVLTQKNVNCFVRYQTIPTLLCKDRGWCPDEAPMFWSPTVGPKPVGYPEKVLEKLSSLDAKMSGLETLPKQISDVASTLKTVSNDVELLHKEIKSLREENCSLREKKSVTRRKNILSWLWFEWLGTIWQETKLGNSWNTYEWWWKHCRSWKQILDSAEKNWWKYITSRYWCRSQTR